MSSVVRLFLWAAVTISLAVTADAADEQIWFAPPDNLERFGVVAAEDFPQLFIQDATWPRAAAQVNVLSLTGFYVLRAPEQELRNVLQFLAARQIALDVTLLALPAENCGQGVEGIVSTVKEPLSVAMRLKQLGADVASFSFDEPLEFGHIYKGRAACKFSIEEVAQRVAITVREVRALYPDAKFIDFEVPQDLPLPEWTTTLDEWLTAYQQSTKTPLDALGIDVHFRQPWQESVRYTIDVLHRRNVKAGIFLTASAGPDVTDASWMNEAKQNARDIYSAQLPLDFVIIATWAHHPRQNLPETDPLALTSLINWYVAQHPVH